MNIHHLQRMIDRYLRKESSEIEQDLIDRWFTSEGEPAMVLDKDKKQQLAVEMLVAIEQYISREENNIRQLKQHRRLLWWRWAAILIPVIAVTWMFFGQRGRYVEKPQQLIADQVFEAPAQGLRKITLTDGSRIYLFPKTILRVPPNYGDTDRFLTIQGRAFVEVADDPQRIFRVKAGNMITRVLGTSFEIREAKHSQRAAVTVKSGKVRVQYGEKVLSDLSAGNRLTYDTVTAIYETEKLDTENTGSWISGRLIFRQTPLQEVCQTLEEWYDVKITAAGRHGLLQEKVTADFTNQPLDKVLQLLSQTLKFRYRITNQQISIY